MCFQKLLQLLKTQVMWILNFTRPHAIAYTNQQYSISVWLLPISYPTKVNGITFWLNFNLRVRSYVNERKGRKARFKVEKMHLMWRTFESMVTEAKVSSILCALAFTMNTCSITCASPWLTISVRPTVLTVVWWTPFAEILRIGFTTPSTATINMTRAFLGRETSRHTWKHCNFALLSCLLCPRQQLNDNFK